MLLTDDLADRLHRLNVKAIRLAAEAAMTFRPDAAWQEIGGGLASYAGAGSPFTQVCEFGHRDPGASIAEVEKFYSGRCESWEVIVSPFTSPEAMRALGEAGYIPGQFEAVLAQRIDHIPADSGIEIEEVTGDTSAWMETAARGWSDSDEAPAEPDEVTRIMSTMTGVRSYLARIDGIPAATASMLVDEDIASFAGASTRLPFRGRGIQNALLARRLRDAGVSRLAVMGAAPGTPSHRNAQRNGFAPLFSKLVMTRR